MAMEHRHGRLRRSMLRRFAALVLTLAVLCSALPAGAFAAAADENTQGDGARTETAADGGFAGLQNDTAAEETDTSFEAEVKTAETDKAENPDTESAEGTEAALEAPDMAENPDAEPVDETEEAKSETADMAEPEMKTAGPDAAEAPDAEPEDEEEATPEATETVEPERDANAAALEPGAEAEPETPQMEESGPADEADPANEPTNPDGAEQLDAEQPEDEAEPEPYADAGANAAQVKKADGTITSYATLEEAWTAAKAAKTATVTLLADVQISNSLHVDGEEDITFNGEGYTLVCDSSNFIGTFHVSAGKLTISGGTIEAIGEQNAGVEALDDGIVNISGGTIKVMREHGVGVYIRSGTVNITGGAVTAAGVGVEVYGGSGSVNISGGMVTAGRLGVTANNLTDNATVVTTITGGMVTAGYRGVDVPIGSTVNITGGTFTVTDQLGIGIAAEGSTVTISGGTVTATGQSNTAIWLNGCTADITGLPLWRWSQMARVYLSLAPAH